MVTNCKECGKEIDKGALTCPHCKADQRSFFRQHKFLSCLLAVLIIGLFCTAYFGGKSNSGPAPPSNFWDSDALNQNKSSGIKITAPELVAAYKASELRANQLYKGKPAEITGTIINIGSHSGRTYLMLSSGISSSFTNVQCFFNDMAETGKVYNLKIGDSVTISGVIEGKTLNVQVNNCRFLAGPESGE